MGENARIKLKTLPLPAVLSQLMNLTEDRPFGALQAEEKEEKRSFGQLLLAWAGSVMPPEEAARLEAQWTRENLLAAWEAGERAVRFDFLSPENGPCRLILRFMTDEDSGQALGVLSFYACERLPAQAPGALAAPGALPVEVLAMPYASFVSCVIIGNIASRGHVWKDELQLFVRPPEGPFYAWLTSFCSRSVQESWQEQYLQQFAREIEGWTEGNRLLTCSFLSGTGMLRQDIYLLPDQSSVTMCMGLSREDAGAGLPLMIQEEDRGMANAVADMQMEMQFERREMRSHTRRVAISLTVLALLCGAVGGAILDRGNNMFSRILDQFLVRNPAAEESLTEIPEEAAAAQEEEQAEDGAGRDTERFYVALADTVSFTSEISESGTPRTSLSEEDYFRGSFEAGVTAVEGPEHFAQAYPEYTMDGTEAGVCLWLRFEDAEDAAAQTDGADGAAGESGEAGADGETGETGEAGDGGERSIVPQDAFYISVAGPDGQTTEEYQLMDREVGGSYQVSVAEGEEKNLYKRYVFSPDISYLILTAYNEGQPAEYCFALRYDDENVMYETLQEGSKSDSVTYLQTRLIEQGYLSGSPDGNFGGGTAQAVRDAQTALGMEPTGIADNDFQHALYAAQ